MSTAPSGGGASRAIGLLGCLLALLSLVLPWYATSISSSAFGYGGSFGGHLRGFDMGAGQMAGLLTLVAFGLGLARRNLWATGAASVGLFFALTAFASPSGSFGINAGVELGDYGSGAIHSSASGGVGPGLFVCLLGLCMGVVGYGLATLRSRRTSVVPDVPSTRSSSFADAESVDAAVEEYRAKPPTKLITEDEVGAAVALGGKEHVHRPTKSCPYCGQHYGIDLAFCPMDGTLLALPLPPPGAPSVNRSEDSTEMLPSPGTVPPSAMAASQPPASNPEHHGDGALRRPDEHLLHPRARALPLVLLVLVGLLAAVLAYLLLYERSAPLTRLASSPAPTPAAAARENGGILTRAKPGFTRQTGTRAFRDQHLNSGEYVDEYAFDVQPGQWIEATMTSSAFDPYLILRPPSCPQGGTCEGQIDNDDFLRGNGAFLWHRAEEAGRWSVRATSAEPGETGVYDLAYRVVPEGGTPATPGVALGDGRTEEGRLETGDGTLGSGEFVDRYGFVAREGDRVTLDVRSSDLHPYLILQMPGEEQLDNDGWQNATDHARIEATLPADGMYRVLVTSYRPGETGSYALTIMLGDGGDEGLYSVSNSHQSAAMPSSSPESRPRAQSLPPRAASMPPRTSAAMADSRATR